MLHPAPLPKRLLLASLLVSVSLFAPLLAQEAAPASPAPKPDAAAAQPAPPAGKIAPRPLYRDPPFDAPTDPVLCYNAEQKKWFMYYTARRGSATDAPGVTWIHGTNIGMAESADGGATWTYRGTADINYGKDAHTKDYTYWAPEVIWVNGTYHMFLTYVPGIFTDWNHPREIVHLTSKDGAKWDTLGQVDLKSEKVIDAGVIQLPSGTWRMWYKDEAKPLSLSYADSSDLVKWEPKGNAVTDFNGEGPKVFHWKGKYWLVADCWANGMRVWSSDDCTNWKLQDTPLLGSHGDVVVSGDRAWWFYFGGGNGGGRGRGGRGNAANAAAPTATAAATPAANQPATTANSTVASASSANATASVASSSSAATSTTASAPAASNTTAAPATPATTTTPAPARGGRGRSIAINVVELSVVDGKLIPGNPAQPTYIDLKPVREEEK